MNTLPVTSVSAAIFAVMITLLGFAVSLRRVKLGGVSYGDGNDGALRLRIRAHGNFIEYAPLALFCVALLEYQRVAHWSVVAIAACFVGTRVLHVVGMLLSRSPAPRAIAMMLQHLTFLASAVLLLRTV